MPLRFRFETSFGVEDSRLVDIVEVQSGPYIGYGECVAEEAPLYNEETVATAREVLVHHILPRVVREELTTPQDVDRLTRAVRGNRMAKSALETAVWDLFAKARGEPLSRLLGGTKSHVEVGISIGIQPTVDRLLEEVARHVAEGYRRIKIKIKPGWDEEPLTAIRAAFPEVPLTVDANTAYRAEDLPRLARFERFALAYMEQPFPEDDLLDHAALQARTATPICLDESVRSVSDARLAVHLGAARVINVKVGRLGGLTPSLALNAFAQDAGIALWCGGMLETGVGRAVNVAIATLPGFTMPGDTAASSRYWDLDLIEPGVAVTDGRIAVPQTPGLGYAVQPDRLARYAVAPPETVWDATA